MTFEQLNFVTYCVGNLSERLGKSAADVFSMLRSTGVLNDYILPAYDVLHTFSKEYIINDLIDCLKSKGAAI
jgi:hypothetical protein